MKRPCKGLACALILCLLELSISPFVFQANAKIQKQLQPARGNVKKLQDTGNVTIALEKNTVAKAGEILYVSRGEQLIGKVKVLKAGAGWCIAKVFSLEKGKNILSGDSVSVSKPEIVTKPAIETQTAPVTVVPEETKKPVETITEKSKEEETKEKKRTIIEEILKDAEEKKDIEVKKRTFKDLKIAILGIKNLSKYEAKNLEERAIGAITYAFVSVNRYKLVERIRLQEILKEQVLEMGGFIEVETAQNIGRLAKADIVLIGSINAIDVFDKGRKIMVNLSIQSIDVNTGNILSLFSKQARGYAEGKAGEDALVAAGLENASKIVVQKMPVEVTSIIQDKVEVGLGEKDGVLKGQSLDVFNLSEKQIGMLKVEKVNEHNSAGTFTGIKKGALITVTDLVLNPSPQGEFKPVKPKRKSNTWMYLGLVLLGGAAAALGGGGGGGGTTTDSTPATILIPPAPPE